jgi:hypothetical protein
VVSVLGPGKAVEEPFHGVTDEKNLEVFARFLGQVE